MLLIFLCKDEAAEDNFFVIHREGYFVIGSCVPHGHIYNTFVSSSLKIGKAPRAPSYSLLSAGVPSLSFQTLRLKKDAVHLKSKDN